jgi:hypothetical protein
VYRKEINMSLAIGAYSLTIIHVASMSYPHHKDDEAIIFNAADDAIVSYTIPPEACKGGR